MNILRISGTIFIKPKESSCYSGCFSFSMDNILKCFTNHELLSKVLRACLCSPVWFSLAVQTVEPDAREKRSQLLGILQCWCQNSVSRLSAGLQVCRSEHYTRLEKGGGGEETDWISTEVIVFKEE
ncbi:uncharacterized protein LOC123934513 isoform X2 [Meles meles]|uniref:uncharacterized protein LOC123934513 isoform X2 n=1 Tax=Meles meles TaxID=9662 RepID=UPI001E69CE63|nr:uncharacterized protein LOC123934513 isoform X2 [Meles meles]